jgi:thymidine kinase
VKLHFKYGTVSSGKTAQLLMMAHAYQNKGKHVILMKPEIDTRYGIEIIESRLGISRNVDIVLRPYNDKFYNTSSKLESKTFTTPCDYILVDEVQFLNETTIDSLRKLECVEHEVICFGLKTDFKGQLFSGSKRLLELADTIEEISTTCWYCSNKATMNMKLVDGKPEFNGPSIELGGDEKYKPVCFECWHAEYQHSKGVR